MVIYGVGVDTNHIGVNNTMKTLLDTNQQKRNNAAEIYKAAFEKVFKTKDEYTKRLILKELDVQTSSDKRILDLFSQQVCEIAEKQM